MAEPHPVPGGQINGGPYGETPDLCTLAQADFKSAVDDRRRHATMTVRWWAGVTAAPRATRRRTGCEPATSREWTHVAPYDDLLALLRAPAKTWLVIGVAGFIGSNLLETPLKRDQTVVGLDNVATGHRHNLDQIDIPVTPTHWARVRVIEGDIRDPDGQRAHIRENRMVSGVTLASLSVLAVVDASRDMIQ